ncbi:MAG TPA: class I SAM-dependent methyltransferase [Solirubrobacteraceae bacterium]|nr:class I SAM-dependent methyltransferase [Solirubrobacteraceae bacterium]
MPRVGAEPENLLERVALRANLAPWPVVHSMFAPPLGRVLQVAARTGVFAALARGPATPESLAAQLDLREPGTRLLLECLTASEIVRESGGTYEMERNARKWLDPESETSVLGFIADNAEYWDWWARLEDLIREGRSVELHDRGADDPYWRTYIRGQFELARLSAPEVARGLKLPGGAESVVDLAGGHGWFAVQLCERHEGLRATVVDLPGSAAVGREIVAEHGFADRVAHVEGDILSAGLGGPHDLALAFNIVHHLSPEDNVKLLSRAREALKPGGSVAVLDLFTRPAGKRPDGSAYLGLFFHLTSGAETYSPAQLTDWLEEAGFERPRRVRVRSIPNQTLYQATVRS